MYKDRPVTHYIIAHGGCPDGTAAAWVAMKYIRENFRNCNCEIIFSSKRCFLLDTGMSPSSFADTHMYILDYMYNYDTISQIKAKSITIIDHHASSYKDCLDCKSLSCKVIHDTTKCAAVLAWEYFYGTNVPWWILYIQDRDLYKWKLPRSRAINEAFYRKKFNKFSDFNSLMNYTETEISALADYGDTFHRETKDLIEGIVKRVHPIQFEGYNCGIINELCRRSEVAEVLADKYDILIFYAYDLPSHKWKVSLRSKTVNVQEIALKYENEEITGSTKGGGHDNAASFKYSGDIIAFFGI